MNGIALIHTGWAENVSEESKAQEQMVSRENNEIMKNIRDKSVWHTIAVDGICSFVDLILHFDRPWDVYPWPQGAQVCQVLCWKLTSTTEPIHYIRLDTLKPHSTNITYPSRIWSHEFRGHQASTLWTATTKYSTTKSAVTPSANYWMKTCSTKHARRGSTIRQPLWWFSPPQYQNQHWYLQVFEVYPSKPPQGKNLKP